MKTARVLLVSLGILVTVGATVLGLALTPSVQRWAVLRAVRDVPGLRLELASVSAGFSGVTLTGVQVEHRGLPVRLDRLEAEFSTLGLAFGRRLEVARLEVTGLHVDASHLARSTTEAAAAGAPVAAPGLLGQVELPFDLVLDDVRIEGRALLPGAPAHPPVDAAFTVVGGKFAPGREGNLQLDATLRNPSNGAKVSLLRVQAALRATLTARRTFDRISLVTLVDAEGSALAGQSQLKVGAELYHTSAGENYEITVSTLLQGVTENVLLLHARLPSGTRQYAGEWALKARTAQLEPFSLGGVLPDFAASGDGHFAWDAAVASISLEGGLQARVSRLETLEPAWRTFGTLNIDADFDLGQQGGVVDLRRFKAAVAGGSPVLDIQNTAPIRYDWRKGELLTSDGFTDALLRVNLQGLPVDWVRPFITQADVSGGLVTGQVDLARASANAADAVVRGQLAFDELNVVRQGYPLVTKAAIKARAEATIAGGAVTAPLVELEVSTPAGDTLRLTGRFAQQAGSGAPVSLAGRFNATTARLLERWFPGAPVTAQGELDVTLRGDMLEVQPGRMEVKQGTGPALVDATLLQPFSLNLAALTLEPRDEAKPVARVTLRRIPLASLPIAQPEAVIGGQLRQGVFELGSAGGTITLQSTAPVRLTDVSLTQNRQPALTGLAVEAQPVIEYAGPGRLNIQTGDMTVSTGQGPLMSLKLEATQSPGQDLQAVLTFTLEVPALATQPLFAGAREVTAGRASGEIRTSVGAHSQLEARMTVNGLTAAGVQQTLPVANIGFRGRVQPGGAVAFQVPVLLDNAGRRSDLNFALDLTPLGRGYSVDGSLTGQQVELEDLLGVLGVFMASAAPDSEDRQPAPTASVPPHTAAAWSRFSGRLYLDVKSVTRGKEWAMTGLTGAMAIEPSLITVQKLSAAFSETSHLAAKMELRFTGGAMPYRLAGDYTLNDFDAGRLFRAIEPSKPPTVEGLFNISGRLAGNGETPARALERVQGEFQLTSRQGVFRGLQRTSTKLSVTSKAVELGASVLGSILGSEKAARTAEKVAGQAYFVDQLAQSIGEFNYDLLSVKLSRDELLNMNLEDISLVSPEIRLNGRGSVAYVAGQPLLEQPLSASLQFAARGKVEQLFAKLRLLDTTKDELGYTRTKDPVTLGGTLAKPDPTPFFSKLATARLVDFLDIE